MRAFASGPARTDCTSRDLNTPAITIRENDVTVDLTGVTLEGGEPYGDPDRYAGVGILIDGGRNVTIRGGAIRGYKVGLLARKTPPPAPHRRRLQLQLETAPAERHRARERRRLAVLSPEREGRVAALRRRHLPQRMRRRARSTTIARCRDRTACWSRKSTQAEDLEQHVLVDVGPRHRDVSDDRQPRDAQQARLGRARLQPRLLQPRPGLCRPADVRADEPQHRGLQLDHARRRRRVPVGRAVHDGHGTGRRERQRVLRQRRQPRRRERHRGDVQPEHDSSAIASRTAGTASGAATATTRRSAPISSRANTDAIAIEHGQNISICDNTFTGDETAIRLWANATQDPNWGYPKTRDTRSRDYTIMGNTFTDNKTAVNVCAPTASRRMQTSLPECDDATRSGPGRHRSELRAHRSLDSQFETMPACRHSRRDERDAPRRRPPRPRDDHRRRLGPVRLPLAEALAVGQADRSAAEAARARTGRDVDGQVDPRRDGVGDVGRRARRNRVDDP